MAYNIYNADGTPYTVADNAIDTGFYNPSANGSGKGVGIQLVGRNAVNFGAATAQNFLQLLENFAGPTPPIDTKSIMGQLWFNTNDLNLYVKFNNNTTGGIANWKLVGGGSTPTTGTGLGTPVIGNVMVAGDGTTTIGHMAVGIPANADASKYVPLSDGAGAIISGVLASPSAGATAAAAVGMTVRIDAGDGSILGYAFP